MREQTIDRLIRLGLKAVVVGIALAAIIYFLDRRAIRAPRSWSGRSPPRRTPSASTPTNVGLRLRLAEIYRAAKRPDGALEQYDAVLKVEAGQSTALLGRGEVLAETGDLSEATKSFKKMIGKTEGAEFAGVNPQLEAAYYGLGSVMMKQGQAQGRHARGEEGGRRSNRRTPTPGTCWGQPP